ncbi:pleckstrin homology domain-containing family A member 5 isoform X24 [Lepisosteus oculatus]|uniref:pleckstrin homology domain-containing family A member 5 isoform X24 n=1 Tax=Lepisosteus oculatus TaxID=7918 RepID=UPI00074007E5|nr:PREDICTED: pleckstrin homology domain-containing family A member 5 isoform X21 [Lepisosteus oculatus]
MAADLNPEWLSCLPSSWSYGVTRDGRVFFINEQAKSTTWLHPVTGEAVITGHRKTPDLPTGWEEGFTFEGARCFINHNERKVTCKHPVSGLPSQDNCIFVVSEHLNSGKLIHPVINRPASKMTSQEKKDRPVSTMSEASNYTMASEYATHPGSPIGRPSRSSKKVHNFGKRSNSIKRNPNAPVIKSGWLYKQDSTGMKLWKKRWFVLSDMCLFYYRDEKEEGILGSILLPSFHISMLSVDDHINRKYAFKATHPNMRTYYFCTDTAKEMESWMKVMTDAALVHTDPIKRLEKPKVEHRIPPEVNNIVNHRVLTRPEVQNNERNREVGRFEEKKQKDAEKYGFQKDGIERPLTKINSIKLQPAVAAAVTAAVTREAENPPAGLIQAGQYKPVQVNGAGERAGNISPGEMGNALGQRSQHLHHEPERTIQRTNSMQQLEQWVRTQRVRGQEDETRSITSYQTLPRNMPSYRAQVVPHYPEGYRTLPRNIGTRPDSICSISPSVYDRALGPLGPDDKRRSMRDDTMWQLYEWQQRQVYTKQGPMGGYGTLTSPKTMINISDHASHSIPPSPSHGSLALYQGYSPLRSYNVGSRSEVSSPVFRGDITIDRRHRPHLTKYAYPPDRRSVPAGIPVQTITPQALQGKTPEELTLLLIKLRRQQAELNSIREHTLAQLMQLNLDASNPKNEILSHHLQRNLMYLDNQMKENEPLIIMVHTMIENSAPRPQLYQQMSQDEYRDAPYVYRPEELDIDAKLSRLCEQDKVVRTQEEKLQQLHSEKHTLEQALLAASQEIEMNADKPAAIQSVVQQRDVLQSGLLSTCRELTRANTELERSWREYDRLESEVTMAKNNLHEQLEALGNPQSEVSSQQHAQIQKELWRIQDVMEALSKNKPQRSTGDAGFLGSKPISNKYKSEEEDSVPPRPPLPQSYDFTERPPIVPPLPTNSSLQLHAVRGVVHRPEDRKMHHAQGCQRNGAHTGPDYRLYKSEPELTTVAEVDESNGDEKLEQSTEKESSSAKGISYPVGIVPPRTKSPMPESSTIASYVTLRKSKKLDSRMDRPRSAVEQLCLVETSRPRMSVEEQLERIRRHQQAALREKKRGLSIIGSQENSPSRSPSFSKENPFKSLQVRKRDDVVSSDIKEIEASLRDQDLDKDQETPAEEIARLKEAVESERYNVDKELSKPEKVLIPERYVESDPEEALSPEQEADKQKKVDRIKAIIAKNSMQNVVPVVNLKTEDTTEEETTVQEQEKMINISYELAAEASKRSKLVAVKSLSSPPQSPTSPSSPSPPQLAEGSHFMCV